MTKVIVNCRFATQEITGVQRYATECSILLKKISSHETIFLAPKGKINKALKKELNIKQIGIFRGHLWEQISLPLHCSRQNGILFSFCGGPSVFYKKLVYTIHDLAFLRFPNFYSKSYFYFYKILFNIALKKSKQIIAVSEFTKKEINKLFNISNVEIVNNSTGHLLRNSEEEKLPPPLKEFRGNYILAIGSNDPRKNLKKLIEVFITERVEGKLVILGNQYKNFSKDSDSMSIATPNVLYTGHLIGGELAACFKNAKCLIYPSFYEGFGIPPLEAIFYNIPIAVSDIPVMREICGNYASYFSPYDIKNLDNIIKKAQAISKSNDFKKEHPIIKRYNSKNQEIQLGQVLNKILRNE